MLTMPKLCESQHKVVITYQFIGVACYFSTIFELDLTDLTLFNRTGVSYFLIWFS